MGVKITIDARQRLVVTTLSGELNDDEIFGTAAVIRSHPEFDPGFSEIVDFSEVSAGNLSTEKIRALSRRESIFSPASMHVAIAPQPLVFGLVRMFQALAARTRPNILLVRTMQEARQALGLGPVPEVPSSSQPKPS